jgi:outer membrane receptor protein involved in Fe transport
MKPRERSSVRRWEVRGSETPREAPRSTPKVAAFLLALLVSSDALADDGVGVDVADLPPLPPATDEPSSSATLHAAADANEETVVGAAKREQSLGNVASAVTVVSADRIRRFGYRTVAEAIAGVAGVFIQDTRLTQQVGIRGMQIPGAFNGRILVLVDGAAVNEAWGAFAGVGFDGIVSIDDIARIEVIRGPVSSQYGTNAFFMTVNIVTRGAAEGARAWGRAGLHSINGQIATAGFATGNIHQQVRGSVMVMNRLGETYRVDEIDPVAPLAADGANTVIATVSGQSGGTFGQVRAYRSRRESPFAPYEADPQLSPGFALYNYQLLVEGGHTRELSKRFTGGIRGYTSLYRYYDEIDDGASGLFVDYGDAATFGGELRGRYELMDEGRLGISGGLEVNYNITESRSYFTADEPGGVTVPKSFSNQGVYTELDSRVTEWFGASAGARFDNNTVVENGRRISPRAALFFNKDQKGGVKLLYAEGFRNPSMFEGFFDDGRDFTKNDNIEPERIRSFELVTWAKLGGLSARVSGFAWDARGIIEQRPVDIGGMERLQFQNVGRYVTYGVEAEGSYRNSAGWYGFGGFALSRVGTEVTDEMTGDTSLEFGGVFGVPSLVGAAGVSTPRLFGKAHLSVEAQYLARRAVRQPETGSSPDVPAWVGLNTTLYFPNLRGFDITVGGRNLIKRDQIPAPDDYDRFPDPMTTVHVPRIPGEGREVYVKVGYTY